MPVVSMKQLLEAGVHFGHQTRRWNPKMGKYIFTQRNGIHIIDLQKTVNGLDSAFDYVRELVANGDKLLFVGTKKQAQEAVRDEAVRAGQFYVNQRWLGGLLTNFKTIQERLRRLDELERMKLTGEMDLRPKKEQLKLGDEMVKLNRLLGGIRTMRRLPAALFIVDCQKEHLAVHEATRLGIPVVALVDTNADPDPVSYPIPANDDAIRAVRLLSGRIADAAIEGQQMRESMQAEAEQEAAEAGETPPNIADATDDEAGAPPLVTDSGDPEVAIAFDEPVPEAEVPGITEPESFAADVSPEAPLEAAAEADEASATVIDAIEGDGGSDLSAVAAVASDPEEEVDLLAESDEAGVDAEAGNEEADADGQTETTAPGEGSEGIAAETDEAAG